MPRRAGPRKDCHNCGDPFRGEGRLCRDCVPLDGRSAAEPSRAFHLAMCRFCRGEITWENVARMTRRNGEGHVECVYSCPACRSVLEFASWQDEKV